MGEGAILVAVRRVEVEVLREKDKRTDSVGGREEATVTMIIGVVLLVRNEGRKGRWVWTLDGWRLRNKLTVVCNCGGNDLCKNFEVTMNDI